MKRGIYCIALPKEEKLMLSYNLIPWLLSHTKCECTKSRRDYKKTQHFSILYFPYSPSSQFAWIYLQWEEGAWEQNHTCHIHVTRLQFLELCEECELAETGGHPSQSALLPGNSQLLGKSSQTNTAPSEKKKTKIINGHLYACASM